jgi:cbb3-type cytochrome oxidase subunit 3
VSYPFSIWMAVFFLTYLIWCFAPNKAIFNNETQIKNELSWGSCSQT